MFDDKIEKLNQKLSEQVDTPNTSFDKRTYTVEEVQNILNISRASAYNLVKKGYFKIVRIGCTIRISKKSFDEWLDSQS